MEKSIANSNLTKLIITFAFLLMGSIANACTKSDSIQGYPEQIYEPHGGIVISPARVMAIKNWAGVCALTQLIRMQEVRTTPSHMTSTLETRGPGSGYINITYHAGTTGTQHCVRADHETQEWIAANVGGFEFVLITTFYSQGPKCVSTSSSGGYSSYFN